MIYVYVPDAGDSGSTGFRMAPCRFGSTPGRYPPAEGIMPMYRAYFIDENDRVESFKPVDADSDEEALAAARQLVNGHDVEVWLLDRMVARLSKRV
jgi:hypothetical protein